MKNLTLKARIIENYGEQFKFSHIVGVPESTVSRVIGGIHKLQEKEKKRWAKMLHSNVADIFPAE